MEGIKGYILIALVSYIIGNFNFSIIFSKTLLKKDVRDYGSGNAGFTNALRSFGAKLGTFVLLCDIAKGVLAVYLAKFVIMAEPDLIAGFVAGFFVAIGHIYPALFNFRGGKGVATIAGVLLMSDWQSFIVGLILFLIVLFSCGYMSVASMSLAVIIPVVTFLYNLLIYKQSISYCLTAAILGLLLGLLIIFTHRTNIKRLKEGTESKLIKRKNKNG